MRAYTSKAQAIEAFAKHVSSAKAAFWQQLNMDFVMGNRDGCWMRDVEGEKKLFNLHTNGGVFNLGHRNPEISRTLIDALDEVDMGNGHLISWARAALAEKIAATMPADLAYTVFGVSGGEAVDLAIKVARAYSGKTKIISAKGGYHGHTGLALAAGDEKYRLPFGPPAPGFEQVPFGSLADLETAVDDDTAAVILETVPATLGMPIASAQYYPGIRKLCDRKGALLILDEVQTGLGRTGKLWAFEHFKVVPDVVVLGKGLSGGIYPISATVIRKPLESVFHPDPHIHVSTFGGSELGCLVALKVLKISSDPRFLDHVNRMADHIRQHVQQLMGRHSILKGLRQLGLFMGLELEDELCGQLLCAAAYQHDLFMVYANNNKSVCQLLPPLIIDENQADWVAGQLDQALAATGEMKKAF